MADISFPVYWNFESLNDMVAHIKESAGKHSKNSSLDTGNSAWNGTQDMAEAMRFARNGWPEGVKIMKRLRKDLGIDHIARLVGESEVESYDVSGSYVDVEVFNQGDPECMVEWIDTIADSPRIVGVYVNSSTSAGTSTAKIHRRGGVTLALVDLLESAGIRTEVIMVDMNVWKPEAANKMYKEDGSLLRVVVKRAESCLDVERLAFSLVSPSFLRRFVFGVQEGEPDVPFGYGTVDAVKPEQVPEYDIVLPTYSCLEDGDQVWDTDDAALRWLRRTLQRHIPGLKV
jgi:hypothetical protein